MGNQSGCSNTGIHHVGLRAANPAASAEFYRDVLGMQIVGGSASDHPLGATAFLSSRPDQESHEIALFANPVFAHIAFKVSSLAELRFFHARVVEKMTASRRLCDFFSRCAAIQETQNSCMKSLKGSFCEDCDHESIGHPPS